MRTLTINQSNWTGKNTKIRINDKTKTVTVLDGTYTLVAKGDELFDILSDQHGNSSIGWVGKMGDGAWVAKSEFADITREDADPLVAVAKLMCNL